MDYLCHDSAIFRMQEIASLTYADGRSGPGGMEPGIGWLASANADLQITLMYTGNISLRSGPSIRSQVGKSSCLTLKVGNIEIEPYMCYHHGRNL